MFKNVLVPLDGFDAAEVVAPFAKSLGTDLSAHVTLI
jgi:nucleotide-binding universal stress UspA family protein